jgi:hypothetical protein
MTPAILVRANTCAFAREFRFHLGKTAAKLTKNEPEKRVRVAMGAQQQNERGHQSRLHANTNTNTNMELRQQL